MTETNTLTNFWGTFVTTGKDTKFTPCLKEGTPKISNPEFSAWVTLCYQMVAKGPGSLEVQTIILLNKQTGHWKFAIPKQEVSGGSVKADLTNSVDLITGEKYLNHKYPMGYRMIGTCHSHLL